MTKQVRSIETLSRTEFQRRSKVHGERQRVMGIPEEDWFSLNFQGPGTSRVPTSTMRDSLSLKRAAKKKGQQP